MTAGIIKANDLDKAISAGDLAKVRSILKENPSLLNEKNIQTLTPVNKALVEGKREIALELINLGADLTIGDKDNSLPIHYAAMMGDIDIYELIRLKTSMSVDIPDNDGATSLFYSISGQKPEMSKYLIGKGADLKVLTKDKYNLLLYAAIFGQTEIAKILIDKKSDVNAKNLRGFTPLHSAVSFGRTDIVKMLVEHGANVNVENDEGETPLFLAARSNTFEAAKYLIENGGDVRHRSKRGLTPLIELSFSGNIRNIELFLEHGADIEEGDSSGINALTYAVWGRNPVEVMKFLIMNGAEVNPDCRRGKTSCCQGDISPLCRAASTGKTDVINLLLSNGAKVNIKDRDGLSPLMLAVKNGNPEAVRTLIAHGAFLDQPDPIIGNTELMIASTLGEEEIVSLLLEKGAKTSLTNKDGNNAMDLAWNYGHKKIAYMLLSKGVNDSKLKDMIQTPSLLDQPVKEKNAAVWFLGHSGWAVKTKNNFLIFDYDMTSGSKSVSDSSLASGYIVPEELKGQKVTVFCSHSHQDHYSKNIFDWRKDLTDINYVFCFVPQGDVENYTYIPIHNEKTINGIKISTIKSTDLDGGFLVEVDGLVIFHPGDLANKEDKLMKAYKDEIDMIASKGIKVDLAFAGIRGCSLGSPAQVKLGVEYLVDKLKPNLLIPMHSGSSTVTYKNFAETFNKEKPAQKVKAVINRGDHFIYTD